MTISDAALAAGLERRHWLCLPRERSRPLWVLVAFGELQVRRGRRRFEPYAPTLAEMTSDLWRVSPRGPRTTLPRRGSRKPVT